MPDDFTPHRDMPWALKLKMVKTKILVKNIFIRNFVRNENSDEKYVSHYTQFIIVIKN